MITWRKSAAGYCLLGINAIALWSSSLGSGTAILNTTGPGDQSVVNTATVKKDANGSEIHLGVGDALVLHLETKPGTGHAWQVTESNEAVLTQLGDSKFEKMDTALLGGATNQVFRFTAQSAGSSRLVLEYKRGWESPARALDSFSLSVMVED